MRFDVGRFGKSAAALGLLAAAMTFGATSASAQSGGAVAPGGGTTTPATPTTPTTPPTTGTPGLATLNADGSATAPPDAPGRVVKAIAAANKIRTKPYIYGGGHRSFKDKGYDCSGAVSFVLHGAGLLKTPMSSGPLGSRWGKPGLGKWITVFGNSSHAYMVVAGLRFDTSAVGESLTSGSGPRWRATARARGRLQRPLRAGRLRHLGRRRRRPPLAEAFRMHSGAGKPDGPDVNSSCHSRRARPAASAAHAARSATSSIERLRGGHAGPDAGRLLR